MYEEEEGMTVNRVHKVFRVKYGDERRNSDYLYYFVFRKSKY
ncbi:hypothetical protein J2Y03_002307 [Neobacillus niacini]|nr:hypothetical protein [Neobacillus niacini]